MSSGFLAVVEVHNVELKFLEFSWNFPKSKADTMLWSASILSLTQENIDFDWLGIFLYLLASPKCWFSESQNMNYVTRPETITEIHIGLYIECGVHFTNYA